MIKFSECITRINQTLNYPALTYNDISHFFDQAIAELNSSFRIGLPLVSEMVREHAINIQELPNLAFLTTEPTGTPSDITKVSSSTDFTDNSKVYVNSTDRLIYRYNMSEEKWVGYNKMYAVYLNDKNQRVLYESIYFYLEATYVWSPVDENRLNDFSLDTYMPDDWVILFLIPYVCFKASVRDGGNGSLYHEEFTQGFQQLQTSYDVPNFVTLNTVAHMEAYKPLVKQYIAALNTKVPTRAVYSSMKVGNAIMPEYGGFHTRGGWGF